MSSVKRPLIIEADGVFGQILSGSIINVGGTAHPTFTVGGRGLLFSDGTSTSPSGGTPFNLQNVYNNSPSVGGQTNIKLATGKDFAIIDDDNDTLYFKVDADTGKVTITGDLEVLGSSTIIDTAIQDSDHWRISPSHAGTIPLQIEPDAGVIPITDLVSIRRTFGTAPVFRIDLNGNAHFAQNISLAGLLNGVDVIHLQSTVQALETNFIAHLAGQVGYQHSAQQVTVTPITDLPGANNVQQALEQLNTKIGAGIGLCRGYEHIQSVASTMWTVTHSMASLRCQISVYDTDNEQLIPDKIKIMDNNTIFVNFGSAVAGRAVIISF